LKNAEITSIVPIIFNREKGSLLNLKNYAGQRLSFLMKFLVPDALMLKPGSALDEREHRPR